MKDKKVLILKKLRTTKDISTKYKRWMNDQDVHRYTEQGHKRHTIEEIREFVKKKNNSKNEFLYGIFIINNKSKIHIGNIKLGPINHKNKSSEISYFIGEKKLWGKGYTTLAIGEIIKKAKKKGINILRAGLYDVNIGSEKVLLKNGFKLDKKIKSQVIYKGKKFNTRWLKKII